MMQSKLNANNIDREIQEYYASIEDLGGLSSYLKGIDFFQHLKREHIGDGPYPDCTVFEAANRIMTDLVILKGVRWLINCKEIPFSLFHVEYGNADRNDHDVTAEKDGKRFCGEAFNVAESFFMIKKTSSLKKLRKKSADAKYKFIIVNIEAVKETYRPKANDGEYYLFVDIRSDKVRIIPEL